MGAVGGAASGAGGAGVGVLCARAAPERSASAETAPSSLLARMVVLPNGSIRFNPRCRDRGICSVNRADRVP